MNGRRRKLRTTCRLCGATLQLHERPEEICDRCLRAYQIGPRYQTQEQPDQ